MKNSLWENISCSQYGIMWKQTRTYTCTYINTHTYKQCTHSPINRHIPTHTHTCRNTHTYAYAQTHTCMYAQTHTHIRTNAYSFTLYNTTYICKYTQIHIITHIRI